MTGTVDHFSFRIKWYCLNIVFCLYTRLSNSEGQAGFMHQPPFFTPEPPSIYQWVSSCLKGEGMPPYPYLPGICERSRLIVLVCSPSVPNLLTFFFLN